MKSRWRMRLPSAPFRSPGRIRPLYGDVFDDDLPYVQTFADHEITPEIWVATRLDIAANVLSRQ